MTCRHQPGDPNCSSNQSRYADPEPATPDASRYEIEAVDQVGPHLVVRARYPNCARCAYEGTKVMVYLDVSSLEAMRWRTIDPHFVNKATRPPTVAPSPAARFPASAKGWQDALAYALFKARETAG